MAPPTPVTPAQGSESRTGSDAAVTARRPGPGAGGPRAGSPSLLYSALRLPPPLPHHRPYIGGSASLKVGRCSSLALEPLAGRAPQLRRARGRAAGHRVARGGACKELGGSRGGHENWRRNRWRPHPGAPGPRVRVTDRVLCRRDGAAARRVSESLVLCPEAPPAITPSSSLYRGICAS